MSTGRSWLGITMALLLCVVCVGCSSLPTRLSSKDVDEPRMIGGIPESIHRTVQANSQSDLYTLEKAEKDGYVFYTADYIKQNAEYEMLLDEEGRIVEIEKDLPPSYLPQTARQSIQAAYPGVSIEEVEEKVMVYYEIEVEQDDTTYIVNTLQNGYILNHGREPEEIEQEMTWAQLPGPVQQRLERYRPDSRPVEVSYERTNKYTYFEAQYDLGGEETLEVQLDASGNIIEIEREKPVAQLSSEIRYKVAYLYPDSVITEVDMKQSTYLYMVDLEQGEDEREVRVLASGQIIGVEKDIL